MYSKESNRRISDSVKWTEKVRGGNGLGTSPKPGVMHAFILVVKFNADIAPGVSGDATVQYEGADRVISVENMHDTVTLKADKIGIAAWISGAYRIIGLLSCPS